MMKTAKDLDSRLDLQREEKRDLQREENRKNAILFVKCCRITFPIIKLNNIQEQQIKRFPRKEPVVLNVCAYYWKVVKYTDRT